ncbi:hypothetical protein GCM10008985_19420 [Halococcus dombrowskii]|uniref:Uncharacterized protein n=1 Tax=Halococcus dombrowskii TaxID=179637 RepID=A0AAV3SHV1_HALDO
MRQLWRTGGVGSVPRRFHLVGRNELDHSLSGLHIGSPEENGDDPSDTIERERWLPTITGLHNHWTDSQSTEADGDGLVAELGIDVSERRDRRLVGVDDEDIVTADDIEASS